MEVEVCHFSTISNVGVHIIHHFSLDNGGECGHLGVSTRMPGHTTHITLASRGDGIVVNLSGGGREVILDWGRALC